MLALRCGALTAAVVVAALSPSTIAAPGDWQREWLRTDFSRALVDLDEIKSGGPPKDGIPSIDAPVFVPIGAVAATLPVAGPPISPATMCRSPSPFAPSIPKRRSSMPTDRRRRRPIQPHDRPLCFHRCLSQ